MKGTKLVVSLAILIIGGIIVILPDNDVRLFSFSEGHGPSIQDAIGLFLVLSSYAFLLHSVWLKRAYLKAFQSSGLFRLGLFLGGLGLGLIIASVANDHLFWWVYGSLILAGVQVPVFYIALRR